MKRLLIYFILYLSALLLKGCSLKHKWQTKHQERLSKTKQTSLNHSLTSQKLVIDTSSYLTYSDFKTYHQWTLSGNVKLHPNGTLQTDHATLESWHSESDSQQNTSSQSTYQNQTLEQESMVHESTNIKKKSNYKEKWKTSLNLWWLLLLLPVFLIWSYRRDRC